jgi:ribonucleoside-triphosphate reductase (thioredoxin)
MELSNELLSVITIFNKYAKFVPETGTRESWEQLVTRNMEMHIRKYPKIEGEIRDAYDFVYAKKVLPSMRSMQFGGRPIELASNRIYNCAYMPIDHIDAFSELMFLLLGGTGAGYSVQLRHVGQLPTVIGTFEERRKFLVGDSIEGWADAIKVLVEAYFLGKSHPVFDLRDIREKGAALVTTGGKAPGPEPLRVCLNTLESTLEANVGKQVSPLICHDICCVIADSVLAGGIRRAALISLFDRTDMSMLKCKSDYPWTTTNIVYDDEYEVFEYSGHYTTTDGETIARRFDVELEDTYHQEKLFDGTAPWYKVEPQRGRANNSAVLPRGEVSQEEFYSIMKRVKDSGCGEPGVYWTNNLDWGTNPCCEIGLKPNQFCNLNEINASDIVDQEDFNARSRAAAFIATLQAGYTDFHYLRPIWKQTTEEDALIGVGLTGIGSGRLSGLDQVEAANIVIEENRRVAKLIGINAAARTTTVKPSGTSSLVVGSSSGVHGWHSDYYIRRMRLGKDEALYKYLSKNMPELVEDDIFNPNGAVASFPQKAPEGAILRTESISSLLERVRSFNLDWVRTGHISGDNTHSGSCTISVKGDEWELITNWMWVNRNCYNGIAVLPFDGGSYVQAPFEDCTKETYESMLEHLTAINLADVREDGDNTDLAGELACSSGFCELVM